MSEPSRPFSEPARPNGDDRASADRPITLAVDAMGGDLGPDAVIDGLERTLTRRASDAPPVAITLFGDEAHLSSALPRAPALAAVAQVEACDSVIAMDARAGDALRTGRDSSMWRAIDAVGSGHAEAALSPGNTGALMTMAMVRLRPADAVSRPAIAALWPSVGPRGASVMLDMGADLRADAEQLAQYAVMGAEYARIALDVAEPRIGLLNVGSEETKGRAEIRDAATLISAMCEAGAAARYVGFIEGNRIAQDDADVIVTDGFSGNIALKTAEGTARLVGDFIREAFDGPLLGKLAGLLIRPQLIRLKRRMDPRRVNGGVFLGLNGLVVKSHGGSDAVAVEAAAGLALRAAEHRIAERIAARISDQVADLAAARLEQGQTDATAQARVHGDVAEAGREKGRDSDLGMATGSG